MVKLLTVAVCAATGSRHSVDAPAHTPKHCSNNFIIECGGASVVGARYTEHLRSRQKSIIIDSNYRGMGVL